MLTNIGLVVLGYLSGSIVSAIIICRVLGREDPRTIGSGNPGTTNVFRLYGWPAACLTLAGDLLKGAIPVFIAGLIKAPDSIIAATGMMAFLGHLYPIFFKFKGGKGVATLTGVMLATNWVLGLAFIGTWLLLALIFRYSSLSSIAAALLTPLYCWLLLHSPAYIIGFSSIAVLLVYRHKQNFMNLISGREPMLGKIKPE